MTANQRGISRSDPLTITELNKGIKDLVEETLPRMWIRGEISNFRPAKSGHWYFSLKDSQSQVRVNMWRSSTYKVDFQPEEGAEVLVYGPINVYMPRGEYSITAEWMESVGQGRLRAKFERLKNELKEKGYFDQKHKKELPFLPQKVGIITSQTGAALQDILRVLQTRMPGMHVVVSHSRVQGKGAESELAAALRQLDQHGDCDVIIIGRGGGSEEDLWAFNQEELATAIFEAKTPIVSAVGHEIDFLISDFVADVRAATPSQAAELIVPTSTECKAAIQDQLHKMKTHLLLKIQRLKARLHSSDFQYVFPRIQNKLYDQQRYLDDLTHQVTGSMESRMNQASTALKAQIDELKSPLLDKTIIRHKEKLSSLSRELRDHCHIQVNDKAYALQSLIARLDDLSPSKVLARGFSVTRNAKGEVISDSEQAVKGEELNLTLHKGQLKVRVE
ncbi:MAG: exodeoxyribonuclease VII large subunit [Acidobacteria bacterium]|nr:MAG: exodeoxyribonuclease VII large subunit [Acidobacteriota bacterium]